MNKRRFFLPLEFINPNLAPGHGACFATDEITVHGRKVGYMYREPPDNDIDSGWRFLAGNESQEYIDDARNTTVYDVNTIANYDPEIIPFLDSPVGSAFQRHPLKGEFEEVEYRPMED